MAADEWRPHNDAVWRAPQEENHPPQDEHQHDGRDLFGTEQLNLEEASRLLARDRARLVVWVGEQGAGKTTLCAELYERQRRGTTGASFAGSWTLLALEQLAYHRRTPGMSLPATTSGLEPDGRDVLHLALSAGETPLHLLLADLSGEVYRRLADNQMAAAEIPWLGRADKLVLLVDGERLLDAGSRSSALTRGRQLIERLRSSGLPKRGARLALLVTKWDLVRADPGATRYWEPREAELLAELRSLDPEAPALRTGAGVRTPHDGFAALCAWLLEVERSAPERIARVWPEAAGEPAESSKPARRAGDRPQPARQAGDWPQPARQADDWPQPARQADDWPQPARQADDWAAAAPQPARQADDWPAPARQADDWPAPANQPDDWPAPANQPDDWPAPANQPDDWPQPARQPDDWPQPAAQPAEWPAAHGEPVRVPYSPPPPVGRFAWPDERRRRPRLPWKWRR